MAVSGKKKTAESTIRMSSASKMRYTLRMGNAVKSRGCQKKRPISKTRELAAELSYAPSCKPSGS